MEPIEKKDVIPANAVALMIQGIAGQLNMGADDELLMGVRGNMFVVAITHNGLKCTTSKQTMSEALAEVAAALHL